MCRKASTHLVEIRSKEWQRIHSTTGVHKGDTLGQHRFATPLGIRLVSFRQQFPVAGVVIITYLYNVQAALLELFPDAVVVMLPLREQLRNIGVTINMAKMAILPPQTARFYRVGSCFACFRWCMCRKHGRVIVVSGLNSSNALIESHAFDVERKGRSKHFVCPVAYSHDA